MAFKKFIAWKENDLKKQRSDDFKKYIFQYHMDYVKKQKE